ncbi:thermonuclease family protein [Falsirhodobacter halotolerans]|uniref:thermonuclease family protein n=1 Tax=Falsirhodobacter halotolerans TaxID=1146892 RepID=UPI001FD36617|nr:thermonuclease family protein [Falsirhodobacter halotolerans]MCJ8139327.1 thermonuclease family protein [Falsirhodobacter halotolerans]
MARRKTSPRIPGPKVWAIAVALVLAGWVFGSDDPQMRQTFFRMAEDLLSHRSAPPEVVAGGARILDGDTVDLNGTRIRLYGIDAPEMAQTCTFGARDWSCGVEARDALAAMIGDHPLSCEKRDTDRYGRTVATCSANGISVNTWMVRNGWALAYRQYGGAIYDANERAARDEKRGIWASEFTAPWDWRAAQRN